MADSSRDSEASNGHRKSLGFLSAPERILGLVAVIGAIAYTVLNAVPWATKETLGERLITIKSDIARLERSDELSAADRYQIREVLQRISERVVRLEVDCAPRHHGDRPPQ